MKLICDFLNIISKNEHCLIITEEGNMGFKKFTILHSNDMHGDFLAEKHSISEEQIGGLSLLSGYINSVRQKEKNVIYTISGDMLQGSIIDSEYKGISTVEIINYLSPDVVTLGNHELDYGLPHLLFLEKMANFPIINANMYLKKNHKRLMQPQIVKHIDGFDILIIGIITEEVLMSLQADSMIATLVNLEDAADEVKRICNYYKNDDIDLTILLTHIGLESDRKLAALLDPGLGVDIILGGHSHSFISQPEQVNNILIAQAGCGTDQVGRFDIAVDDETNSIMDWKWELIPISSSFVPPDDNLQVFIDNYKNQIDGKYGALLCRFNKSLTNYKREEETPLGNLIIDILTDNAQCDIGLLGSASIRCKTMGPVVTLGNLVGAFPYEDSFLRFDVNGKIIRQIFSHILRPENRNHDGECFQVSKGVQAVYRDSDRMLVSLKLNGKEIEEDNNYRLGFQGFHFKNSNSNLNVSQNELLQISGKKTTTSSTCDVIEEYFRSHQNITAELEDRLVFI